MLINPLHPLLPTENDNLITWDGLMGAAASLAVTTLASSLSRPVIVITPDALTAEKMYREITFFNHHALPLYLFPDRETLPFDHFSPHEDLTSERLHILSRLPSLQQGIVITAVTTAMHRLPPLSFLQGTTFSWKIKDIFDLTSQQKQ